MMLDRVSNRLDTPSQGFRDFPRDIGLARSRLGESPPSFKNIVPFRIGKLCEPFATPDLGPVLRNEPIDAAL